MASVWLCGPVSPAVGTALSGAGHAVRAVDPEGPVEAGAEAPDAAFLAAGGPGALATLRRMLAASPPTAWILVLPSDRAGLAEGALEAGAADVCLEPLSGEAALVVLARVLRDVRARARLAFFEDGHAEAQLEEILGDSPAMRSLMERITRIARRSALGPPLPILLSGETGTGKGLLARALHHSSRRRDGPFVEVNCAALPAGLLEAELFGYERGAFTDARAPRIGLFEAAHSGTLLLDEVHCLAVEAQAKLLNVLESRKVRRLGSTLERKVDVQVVAATSAALDEQIASGGFRPELWHRLSALAFHLPPLRERSRDAEALARHFALRASATYGLPARALGDDALEAIRSHAWPGNVRELKNAVERAVLSCEGDVVRAEDLALGRGAGAAVEPAQGGIRVAFPSEGIPLDDIEKAVLQEALRAAAGNVTRAAALLRISRDTLRSRMEKHGLAAHRNRDE